MGTAHLKLNDLFVPRIESVLRTRRNIKGNERRNGGMHNNPQGPAGI